MSSLFERYRPRTWSEVIGQPKAVATLQRLAADGIGGRAIWLSGKSGTGKTTLARLAAAELCDPCNLVEADATGLTVSDVEEFQRSGRFRAFGEKTGRAFIVNEAHGLKPGVVRRLLTALEPIPEHCLWVFTTTITGQQLLLDGVEDGGPLLSRCSPKIELDQKPGAELLAEYVRKIAQAEGLDGQPLARYVRLVNECRANLRACLSEIEGGAMLAK